MKKILIIGLIFLAFFPSAQASIFDDLSHILMPVQTPAITQPVDGYTAFMGQMYKLNTPEAIQSLNAEMDVYGVRAIKITVSRIPREYTSKSFFVARDLGVIPKAQNYDREVALTYTQVMRMYPYFEDGKLDFFDRWQLFAIWKMG
jgi:hypothetical protein